MKSSLVLLSIFVFLLAILLLIALFKLSRLKERLEGKVEELMLINTGITVAYQYERHQNKTMSGYLSQECERHKLYCAELKQQIDTEARKAISSIVKQAISIARDNFVCDVNPEVLVGAVEEHTDAAVKSLVSAVDEVQKMDCYEDLEL